MLPLCYAAHLQLDKVVRKKNSELCSKPNEKFQIFCLNRQEMSWARARNCFRRPPLDGRRSLMEREEAPTEENRDQVRLFFGPKKIRARTFFPSLKTFQSFVNKSMTTTKEWKKEIGLDFANWKIT